MRTVGKDRPALLEKPRLNQSRVTWSKNENQFLFMFKVSLKTFITLRIN